MRTKHFLFSMALGAAVVGCSDNELATMQDNAVDAKLSVRPVVDTEITLSDWGANTRMGIGTGARPVWSTNDKIGAAIIDEPKYTSAADYASRLVTAITAGKDVTELYDVKEWYGCNNAFSTTDAGHTWAAEHPMVEGNYLFYAPYNENMQFRSPLTVVVPKLQDASSAKSALDEFYKSGSVVQLGYKFITGNDRKKPTDIKMFNIFAYPKFTIKNEFDGYLFDAKGANASAAAAYSGKIKVDSIQFVNVDDNQAALITAQIGGKLTHKIGVVEGMKADGDWNDVDKVLAEVTTASLLNASEAIVAGRGIGSLAGVITTLKVGQEIEKGESIDVYCVMPAMKFNFDDNQLVAKFFVTINDVQYEIYQAAFASTGKETWATSDVKLNAAADKKGCLFDAKGNAGLKTLSFMAGQSYPSEALKVLANGNYAKKEGVNNLLEIKLVGGKADKDNVKNVQIAVRKNAANEGIVTTDDLIRKIENAANGTIWEENATDGANAKGFELAPVNTVEINSALIDALAKNNQNGGSFKLTASVLPIANDVVLGAIDGKTSGSKYATFTSANGNTAKIDLANAVVDDNKYILISSAETTVTSNGNAVILIGAGGSLTLSADLTAKSIIVAPEVTGASAAVAGIASVANNKITAGNINNYGTMTVKDVVTENILNKNSMTVNGTISAPAGKKVALTNGGTITTGDAAASFTVTAGTGKIILPSASASSAALVGAEATQEVIYQAGAAEASDVVAAAAIPTVTTFEATTSITLTAKADVAKFGAIKKIIATGNIVTSSIMEEIDMTGFTLVLSGAVTWTGGNVNQSVVKGLTVNSGANLLTLANVAMTNATLTNGKKNGGVLANGTTSKWNGGASAAIK